MREEIIEKSLVRPSDKTANCQKVVGIEYQLSTSALNQYCSYVSLVHAMWFISQPIFKIQNKDKLNDIIR